MWKDLYGILKTPNLIEKRGERVKESSEVGFKKIDLAEEYKTETKQEHKNHKNKTRTQNQGDNRLTVYCRNPSKKRSCNVN